MLCSKVPWRPGDTTSLPSLTHILWAELATVSISCWVNFILAGRAADCGPTRTWTARPPCAGGMKTAWLSPEGVTSACLSFWIFKVKLNFLWQGEGKIPDCLKSTDRSVMTYPFQYANETLLTQPCHILYFPSLNFHLPLQEGWSS